MKPRSRINSEHPAGSALPHPGAAGSGSARARSPEWEFHPARYVGLSAAAIEYLRGADQLNWNNIFEREKPDPDQRPRLTGLNALSVTRQFKELPSTQYTQVLRAMLRDAERWIPVIRALAQEPIPGLLMLTDFEDAFVEYPRGNVAAAAAGFVYAFLDSQGQLPAMRAIVRQARGEVFIEIAGPPYQPVEVAAWQAGLNALLARERPILEDRVLLQSAFNAMGSRAQKQIRTWVEATYPDHPAAQAAMPVADDDFG